MPTKTRTPKRSPRGQKKDDGSWVWKPTPRPAGRPSFFPGKAVQINARITQDAATALQHIADVEGYTVSDALELCIRKTAKLPIHVERK